MRAKRKVSERERIEAFFNQRIQGDKISYWFSHARLIKQKKFAMHPIFYQGFPKRTFGLSNLVCVVDADMVNSAGVNIKRLT